jgi:tRNA threonylcarbamoyl adenosine modification protein YeaZ
MVGVFAMTKVLAIDTSTSRTCVAIIDGEKVLFNEYLAGATAHGPSLPQLVKAALQVSDVDEVVVGMGPGPFTGLRVGIAFAQSFALAKNISVRGVCSLDAIAAQVDSKDFIVTVDARRKEVYWARYTDGVRVGEPAVNFPADVSGAKIHADLFPDLTALVKLPGNIGQPLYLRRPDAVATADRK